MRSVVGGIGYRDLRDHSLGPMISDALAGRALPAGTEAHDLSYNPVAVGQWLDAMPAGERPARLVLVTALERGRRPGTAVEYRWDGVLPDATERIQSAVADAVTGVIHLDNTLIVLAQFGPLPEEVVVVEVEPAIEEFGEALSPLLAPRLAPLVERCLALATSADVDGLPVHGLGGPTPIQSAEPSRNGNDSGARPQNPGPPTEIRRL